MLPWYEHGANEGGRKKLKKEYMNKVWTWCRVEENGGVSRTWKAAQICIGKRGLESIVNNSVQI